jgi:hypothetical protein
MFREVQQLGIIDAVRKHLTVAPIFDLITALPGQGWECSAMISRKLP